MLLLLYSYIIAFICIGPAVQKVYSQQQTSYHWYNESPTTTRQRGLHSHIPALTDDLFAWYGLDSVNLTEQRTPEKVDRVQRRQTVFLGVELVDWLQWRVPRLCLRPDAVHYACQLLVDGLIYHVDVEDDYSDTSRSFDECSLYAFTPQPSDIHRLNWRR